MNTDRSFFQVVCWFRHSNSYAAGHDALLDQHEVIDWIVTGQFENIERIFEFNPSEGWSRDVTDDVMLAANVKREALGRPALEVA